MALGAWLGDDSFFKVGLKQWDVTLGTMRDDGSLPHETARGSRAIMYTGVTLTKLVRLAELARVQGIDIYNKKVNGKTFHDAVSFMLDAVEKPEIVYKYAKVNRDSGGSLPYTEQEAKNLYSGMFAWIKPYLLRFPEHPNSTRILNMEYNKNYFTKVFGAATRSKSSNNNSLNLEQSCFYNTHVKKIDKEKQPSQDDFANTNFIKARKLIRSDPKFRECIIKEGIEADKVRIARFIPAADYVQVTIKDVTKTKCFEAKISCEGDCD